jgi:mannose-1-phosphate guanylyltransferase
MKALILAGGFGTRLRPLTYTRPKHLLPIANRPHIERVFDLLTAHGITEVVLLTSYLSDAFDEVIRNAATAGLSASTTFEEEPLGTAGAFKNAQSFVGDEPFIAFNGDILTDMDLTQVMEWHRSKSAVATIVLHSVEDPSAFGVVPTDDDGRVLGFIEKPPPGEAPTNLINAGVYVFEPQVLDHIPEGEPWSAERQLFPELVEQDAGLFALASDAYWMDIGTPDKLLQANLDALSGRYKASDVDADPNGVVAAPGARIEGGARVQRSCLADGVVIETGAVVEESVLLAGVTVRSGATVRRSTLGAGVEVQAGAEVSDAAVGDEEAIAAPTA